MVAARDACERPWVTILSGPPGFAHAPAPETLAVGARPADGDALEDALRPGADVGVLGIELHTRRRNRVNGRVSSLREGGFEIGVEQAFGNCPQYIRERAWTDAPTTTVRSTTHDRLSRDLRRWIESADTFFIGSGYRGPGESPSFGMDASHRGGEPGFVDVLDETHLAFPDYAGNNHFNTIGNLVLDARVGLVFVDFENGDLLQLTGRASVDFEPEASAAPGAQRIVHFELDRAIELRGALPLRWRTQGEAVRELRVVEKRRESDDVTSFVLAARDAGALPAFAAGQYLPVELLIPEVGTVERTYSLSGPPTADTYRITVKREPRGLASRFLHDRVREGDFLTAGEPRGDFVLDPAHRRPIVLASAGVGVTPMVSFLHSLAEDPGDRPVWFVHGARDGRHHPLAGEVAQKARSEHIHLHRVFSRPIAEDRPGLDYDSVGHIDGALLESLLPDLDADFYLCGPARFLADLEEALDQRGVPEARIHSETFGPVGSGDRR